MSNHYHAVILDRCSRYPEFVEHFPLQRSGGAGGAGEQKGHGDSALGRLVELDRLLDAREHHEGRQHRVIRAHHELGDSAMGRADSQPRIGGDSGREIVLPLPS